ncbi:diguanylate cyclase [Methyloversatilis thermotolerans]|uniref:diguanylate cyclase n=1 Tax=Methyloversatilis thermotolerans TaxID=1346290 RepID=UPI00035F59DB|nr:diguanylate cyclase [Methyloversatilis thermotolerans]
MNELIDLNRFEEIKAAGELPSPKGIALSIARTSQRGDASLAELARLIQGDPALVGRLVRAANGTLPAGSRPVVALRDALAVLGMAAVRNLALGFSLISSNGDGLCRSFPYSRFWTGSVIRAIAMQKIMMRLRSAGVEESFSVGLLSSIGELGLASVFPVQYSRVLDEARGDAGALLGLERQAFAMTHVELSAAMLQDWGMPRFFVSAVLGHRNALHTVFEPGSREQGLTLALGLARAVQFICMTEGAEQAVELDAARALAARMEWVPEQVGLLIDEVALDWKDWSRMLPVDAYALPSVHPAPPAAAPAGAPEQVVAQPAANDAPVGDGLRVLVVEDDASTRMTLQALLQRNGYQVESAVDGVAGMDHALDFQPHIMVIDWAMPQMNGLELTRTLRQTRIGRSIYIIMLTGHEDDARLIEAFESGADDYMVKPLRPRVLEARLRAGQRLVRMQKELEIEREEIRRYAAELGISNRRLQEIALTDSLTGLPNRRYAMSRLGQEWAISLRSERPLSCLLIDIDHFRQINDTYGRDVADQLLERTARTLRDGARAQDVICRTGGDEFLIICPDTDIDQAMACAQRLCASVAATPTMAGRLRLASSISIGAAGRLAAMPDADSLLTLADQALMNAKKDGRNRACRAT